MSNLVPAKAHKAPVILRAVSPHHDIGLKVSFPLYPVGCGCSPPFGKVCWCMAFSPHMVPEQETKGFNFLLPVFIYYLGCIPNGSSLRWIHNNEGVKQFLECEMANIHFSR